MQHHVWEKDLDERCTEKRLLSIHLTPASRRKPPQEPGQAIRMVSETQIRLPLSSHSPPVKSFTRALLRAQGTFSFSALFSILLRCSFHGWLHTIHQKCFARSPPSTPTSPPPLPFLLLSPPALIYTRVMESFCSSLQKITVPSKMQKSPASIPLRLLVQKDSCQGAGSHTSRRIPVITPPPLPAAAQVPDAAPGGGPPAPHRPRCASGSPAYTRAPAPFFLLANCTGRMLINSPRKE